MALVGLHQQFENPMSLIPITAKDLGAEAYQTFVRNGRNMRRREITDSEINLYNYNVINSGINNFVAHAPYAMNPCRCDDSYRRTTISIVKEDLKLLSRLSGNKYYVLHPGSSLDYPEDIALNNLCSILEEVYENVYNTKIAVEMMAGAGTQMLSTFAQIDYFLDKMTDYPMVGLCYDTCHVFGAGMDLFETLYRYKDKINVAHLNGSKAMFGTRVDRHASIRNSQIPLDLISSIAMNIDYMLPDTPMILETPESEQLLDLYYLLDLFNKNR